MILQPCSIFGPYGTDGWCKLFGMLKETGGRLPGLPGSSSFCDARDLADAFVAAATAGPGRCERYIIGGTNASTMDMLREMARLVGTPAPRTATPAAVLWFFAKWNEAVLRLPLLNRLQILKAKIGPPWLMAKLTQDMSTGSEAARRVLGYKPRPLRDILESNYEWLRANSHL